MQYRHMRRQGMSNSAVPRPKSCPIARHYHGSNAPQLDLKPRARFSIKTRE